MGKQHGPYLAGIFDFWKKKKDEPPPAPSPQVPRGIDFYAVMGVRPDVTDDELRAAFRMLARRLHPDATGNDPAASQQFARVTEAFEVLRDPVRRAKFDQSRGAAAPQAPPPARSMIVPQPRPPSIFQAFRAPPTAIPTAAPPEKPKERTRGEPTMWERMFGEAEEAKQRTPAAPERMFDPFTPAPASPPFHFPVTPTPKTPRPFMPQGSYLPGPQILPSVPEMAEFIQSYWPLDAIWDVIRDARRSGLFQRHGGILAVDRLGGSDPREIIEYELAEHLGLDNALINDYQRRGTLRSALWSEILYPMFDLVGQAFQIAKPQDLPGYFFVAPTADMLAVDLFYDEQSIPGPGR